MGFINRKGDKLDSFKRTIAIEGTDQQEATLIVMSACHGKEAYFNITSYDDKAQMYQFCIVAEASTFIDVSDKLNKIINSLNYAIREHMISFAY